MNKNEPTFNTQQKEAICFGLKSVLIMAGAGTGKTTILTHRIKYLINELGIHPARILAITFTNKAANEMNERIEKNIGYKIPWIGTFHKICLQILEKEIHRIGRNKNFKILDEEGSLSLIKGIMNDLQINKTKRGDNQLSPKSVLALIDKIKVNQWSIEHLEKFEYQKKLDLCFLDKRTNFLQIYNLYQQRMFNYNYIDFNDIINITNQIFDEHPNVATEWAKKFDYILVDEFQDTNNSQYNLLSHLGRDNIFAVGDEDQIIYTFRGANSQIIDQFVNSSTNDKIPILKLEENYRSNNQILKVANSLIENNKGRIRKVLYSNIPDGNKPKVLTFESEKHEAWYIASEIKRLQALGENLSDIAILYRSNYTSREYEQAMISSNIKYNLYGGFKFYQRSEIKDILSYLQVIDDYDENSLHRIINLPRRRISDEMVNQISDYSFKNNLSFWHGLNECNKIETLSPTQKNAIKAFLTLINELKNESLYDFGAFFDKLIKKIDYHEHIKKNEPKKIESILENIEELKKSIVNDKLENQDNWTLSKYLNRISLYTTIDDKKKHDNAVTLSTIHSVKGLEYKNVFLVSFNDGQFPSNRSIETNELVEERRLAYVAFTRAKNRLVICTNLGSYNNERIPSRFIKEIDQSLIEKSSKNKFIKISNNNDDWFNSKREKIDITQNYNLEQTNDYKIGDKLVHQVFGEGEIVGINNDILEIFFKDKNRVLNIIFNHKSILRKLV